MSALSVSCMTSFYVMYSVVVMRRITHMLHWSNSPKSRAVESSQHPEPGVTTQTYISNHCSILCPPDSRVNTLPGMGKAQVCSGPTLKSPNRILGPEGLQAKYKVLCAQDCMTSRSLAKQSCVSGNWPVLRIPEWIWRFCSKAVQSCCRTWGDTLGPLVGTGTSWVVLASLGIGHCCCTQPQKILELTYR